jgi:hypothetical protein
VRPVTHSDQNKILRDMLESLVEYDSHSIEYDGRVLLVCPSCGGQDGTHHTKCDFIKAREILATPIEEDRDGERYRWLRDVSVPPHNFYLSVPDEYASVKYTPAEVDAAIDLAIATFKTKR